MNVQMKTKLSRKSTESLQNRVCMSRDKNYFVSLSIVENWKSKISPVRITEE